ncbi:MAG: dihydroneopterin aldolase [Candidatus Symbiothrix sp.]|jgi:dihydroneopterin aldolase|nr:dihydroneopterin aldolase [Candidatus Symbiothrix sp.]
MQYLELKGMIFHAYHGVMAQERMVGNTYTVDLKLFFELTPAALSDNLDDTINYAVVYETVKHEMATPSNLIEHVAYRIVSALKKQFENIESVEIRLSKKNPPVSGDVQESAVFIKL